MSFAEQIEKDYIEAYKSKETVRLGTLRHIKTAAKNLQVELLRPLTDEDYIDIFLKQAKQRQDSIDQYTAAGRQDLADQEAAELDVLRAYLPKQLSQDELNTVIEEAVTPHLAEGMKAMGKVIASIMGRYKGQVDGKALSEAVKARLLGASK